MGEGKKWDWVGWRGRERKLMRNVLIMGSGRYKQEEKSREKSTER